MASAELNSIAMKMVARKKGILAADESTGTMTRRLDSINVESTAETRRQWRQLLFKTSDIGDYISGVILYDETIRQSDDNGVSFLDVLAESDILSGIKVDNSTHDLAGAPGWAPATSPPASFRGLPSQDSTTWFSPTGSPGSATA